MASYAVIWSEASGASGVGKLVLCRKHLRLEGTAAGGCRLVRTLAYGRLAAVRISRSPAERIGGRPALVLERGDGHTLRIGSIDKPGTLHELAERLSSIRVSGRG